MQYIRDEWMIEMALIPRLLFNLVQTGATTEEEVPPEKQEQFEREKVEVQELLLLLDRAYIEPFENVYPDKKKRNLVRRAEKAYLFIMNQWVNKVDNAKVALLLDRFMDDVFDEGYLTVQEGTAFDQALKLYRPMIQHFYEIPKLVNSAEKHKSWVRDEFRKIGYFLRPGDKGYDRLVETNSAA